MARRLRRRPSRTTRILNSCAVRRSTRSRFERWGGEGFLEPDLVAQGNAVELHALGVAGRRGEHVGYDARQPVAAALVEAEVPDVRGRRRARRPSRPQQRGPSPPPRSAPCGPGRGSSPRGGGRGSSPPTWRRRARRPGRARPAHRSRGSRRPARGRWRTRASSRSLRTGGRSPRGRGAGRRAVGGARPRRPRYQDRLRPLPRPHSPCHRPMTREDASSMSSAWRSRRSEPSFAYWLRFHEPFFFIAHEAVFGETPRRTRSAR